MKFLIILNSMNSFIDFHWIDRSHGCKTLQLLLTVTVIHLKLISCKIALIIVVLWYEIQLGLRSTYFCVCNKMRVSSNHFYQWKMFAFWFLTDFSLFFYSISPSQLFITSSREKHGQIWRNAIALIEKTNKKVAH